MGNLIEVHGMELSSMPVGEYDRRIVLLTKERGKIAAFARGARRTNSPLMGVTRGFLFGTFQMYEGREYYVLKQANITHFFDEIVKDYNAICYACYFAELAEYYARENLDATDMINLLYVTFKALTKAVIPYSLIKCIYELKIIALNGECVDLFTCKECQEEKNNIIGYVPNFQGVLCADCCNTTNNHVISKIARIEMLQLSPSTVYALQYIVTSSIDKLYTFKLNDNCMKELSEVIGVIRNSTIDREFKSLGMIVP